MVQDQLVKRGLSDQNIIDVFLNTPRHLFVSEPLTDLAYDDGPLPIGYGQTISQPYIVAFMTEQLRVKPHQIVLEIGTGCGYQTAILSQLVEKVVSIEVVPELASEAQQRLWNLGYENIETHCANGLFGWKSDAPYDRIMVTAAPKSLPQPLIDQLKPGGRMILPIGSSVFNQRLKILTKTEDGSIDICPSLPVRFVPLVDKSPHVKTD